MGRRTSADSTGTRRPAKRPINVIVSSDEDECTQSPISGATEVTRPAAADIPESQPIPDMAELYESDADDENTDGEDAPPAKKQTTQGAGHDAGGSSSFYPKTWMTAPNLDVDLPKPPPNTRPPPIECAKDLFMQPQARIAYKFGDGKYAVLAGNGPKEAAYTVHVRHFGSVKGSTILYPSNEKVVRMDAQQCANLMYEL